MPDRPLSDRIFASAFPVGMTVTVCISTFGERVLALSAARLPACPGLHYHIVLQSPDAAGRQHLRDLVRPDPVGQDPAQQDYAQQDLVQRDLDRRDDITFVEMAGRGVARSRNVVLDTAPGDIAVLADDDLEFMIASYPALVRAFVQEPDLGCICGIVAGPDGRSRKRPVRAGARLRAWNVARVGTPEIALRLAEIRRLGLRFDEDFGAGTNLPIGDEFIFLVQGLRAGLKGRHMALTLAVHPAESSGLIFDAASLEVRRAVFRRAMGRGSWLFRLGFAVKNRRRFPSLRTALHFLRP